MDNLTPKHERISQKLSISNAKACAVGTYFFTLLQLHRLIHRPGIPETVGILGIPAWMAMNGKTPGAIGGFVAYWTSLEICGGPFNG